MDKLILWGLYGILGLVVWSLGFTWTMWQFWAVVVMVIIIGDRERTIGRLETSTVMIIALQSMGVDVDRLVKVMSSDT